MNHFGSYHIHEDYRAFLNEFANRLTTWKQANGWTFDIYAGALNRVSELPKSETVPAVVSVVNNNPNVVGLDLHVIISAEVSLSTWTDNLPSNVFMPWENVPENYSPNLSLKRILPRKCVKLLLTILPVGCPANLALASAASINFPR